VSNWLHTRGRKLLGLLSDSDARQAYRELEGINEVLYIRESPSTLRIRMQPRGLLDTDVQTTTEAIAQAIQSLSEAENDI